MDVGTTKLMSVHVEALLPPTSVELDIPQNVQVAALLGVGLVFEGTAHRHIAEVLLLEIGNTAIVSSLTKLHICLFYTCRL
jgi:anaphase-promoting complex subunit 1